MSTTQSPVVLLVQQSRDDGLEMYAECLRYHSLAVIAVSNARNALMLAREADIIVMGIILDDQIDGVELISRLRHDDGAMHKPIIVLIAGARRTDRERVEHAGVTRSCPSRACRTTCCAMCGSYYAQRTSGTCPQTGQKRG